MQFTLCRHPYEMEPVSLKFISGVLTDVEGTAYF